MIPGIDIVPIGEVEEHALAVPLPPVPLILPFCIRKCSYGNFVFKLDERCSWIYTVGSLVEVSAQLTIFGGFEYSLCFKVLVLEVRYSLCEVVNLIKVGTI